MDKQLVKIKLNPQADSTLTISELLPNQQLPLYCGGQGLCGKCVVQVLSGTCAALTEQEAQLLSGEQIRQGYRLACLAVPQSDLVLAIKTIAQQVVLTVPRVDENGAVNNKQANHTDMGRYGLAVDIGTTTVEISLIDLEQKVVAANIVGNNRQINYGLDVLTRIDFCRQEQGTQILQQTIVACLNHLIDVLIQDRQILRTAIQQVVIAANTVMTHLLLGVNPQTLGVAPYVPVFTQARELTATTLGLHLQATVYCCGSIAGFIGGDVVAAMIAADLKDKTVNTVLIDVGTNGEMVLKNQQRLVAVSCAVGPALEGMNIACGMRAGNGAVTKVALTDEQIELTVMGQGQPQGLCGSGLLEAVAELLRVGAIESSGKFNKNNPWVKKYLTGSCFVLDAEQHLYLSQQDIRNVQLAKAALAAGFTALLNYCHLACQDIGEIIIAGQLGTYLSEDLLIRLGILPAAIKGKLLYGGNLACMGAEKILLNPAQKKLATQLQSQVESVNLNELADYQQLFIDCLRFPERIGADNE